MSKSGGFGGMNDLLKQAQEMQSKLAELQQKVQQQTVEASSGGGMVTALMNGRMELVSLKVDPAIAADGDVEMLQDLVVAAVNEAVRKAQQMMADEMSRATGGLKIPGLMG